MNIATSRYYTGLTPLPNDTETTMAYVPFQTDSSMYNEEYALTKGTLFPNLDKPLMKGSDCCD